MTPQGWVAVAQYSSSTEAHIAAGMLEDNGIDVIIDSPVMSTLYGAGSTWAPVVVYVPQAQYERAAELLQTHGD